MWKIKNRKWYGQFSGQQKKSPFESRLDKRHKIYDNFTLFNGLLSLWKILENDGIALSEAWRIFEDRFWSKTLPKKSERKNIIMVILKQVILIGLIRDINTKGNPVQMFWLESNLKVFINVKLARNFLKHSSSSL